MRRYTVKLDLEQPASQQTSIVLNQANVESVDFLIKIYQGSAEIDYAQYESAELIFQKPDKNNVIDAGVISANGISYTLRPEIFESAGKVIGYLNLYNAETVTVTATLYYTFMIVSDLLNIEELSKTYNGVIQRLVADMFIMWSFFEQISAEMSSFVSEWSEIANKPTTVDGFGITDAVKKSGDNMYGQLLLAGNSTGPAQLRLESEYTFMIQMPSGNQIVTPPPLTYIRNHKDYFDIERHQREEDPDYRKLRLNKYSVALKDALQFIEKINEVETVYPIWGKHNLPNAADYENRINKLETDFAELPDSNGGGELFTGSIGNDYGAAEKPVMIIENGEVRQMKDNAFWPVYERTFIGNSAVAANSPGFLTLMSGVQEIFSVDGWFQRGGSTGTKFSIGANWNIDDFGVNAGVYLDGGNIVFYSRSIYDRSGMQNTGYWIHVRYTRGG